MMSLGAPLTDSARRVILLGCGELGKEVAIELQRLGVEVIGVDRYENAPAMQVAHRSHVIDMLDGEALQRVIEQEHPALIVPEIEAIATDTLLALEARGHRVVPVAGAAHITMNRERIRRLAAEELRLPTSPYRFADSAEACAEAVEALGLPAFIKPVMSSSGKGQSMVRNVSEVAHAWEHAQTAGRAGGGRVIVEGQVSFESEITLLTVRHRGRDGQVRTSYCAPIGHRQEDGDYRESWQPHSVSKAALERAQEMAGKITAALCEDRTDAGFGVFGVEFFLQGDEVIFSEVSPRPHDTGLVTLMTQDLSQFALHARAILGLPIPVIRQLGPGASYALLAEGDSNAPRFEGLEDALAMCDVHLRLFGKPQVHGRRRMGVVLAASDTLAESRLRAQAAADSIRIVLE
ncbi:MAG: formate-dependent phosphoribosylglycinamide formyltransferase [Pseudomonadota bacterium]